MNSAQYENFLRLQCGVSFVCNQYHANFALLIIIFILFVLTKILVWASYVHVHINIEKYTVHAVKLR